MITDDKQRKWHPEKDQGKRAEAENCNKLQVSDDGSKPEILSRIAQTSLER